MINNDLMQIFYSVSTFLIENWWFLLDVAAF